MGKGRDLAKELGIDCPQALYSSWGNFYAPITKYPCVLFDKAGLLFINLPDDLDGFGIKLGKRTNVRKRISSAAGYQLISAWRVRLAEEISQEEQAYFEGAAATVTVNRYERDRKARNKCISHYGCACQACGVKLSAICGPVAKDLIQVHHTTMISSIGQEYQLDPIRDLVPLCPNCHAVAHLRREPHSIEELQNMLVKHRETA